MPDIFVSDTTEKKRKRYPESSGRSALKEKKVRTERRKESKGLEDALIGKRKRRNISPFFAYGYMPKNVDFVTRESKEKIILVLRRHLITNIGWISLSILMIFAPAVLAAFPFLDFLPGRFRLIAVLGWYLITTAFILENFLHWFFDVNIITDERSVDIDFVKLIYRETSEASINNIQDVTTRLGGATRTVFNYGDIFIQTAAEVQDIEFLAVPKPDKVAKILRQLRTEREEKSLQKGHKSGLRK